MGNLEHAKRLALYRDNFAKICFCTHEPDLSEVTRPEYDWSTSVHGKPKEVLSHDSLRVLGKPGVTFPWADAMHGFLLLDQW